ncbi:MAG: hypothetical protein HOV87_28495 [Catenulispora sp.]|nr:hypothetical protein [Catenulispora sp.]
MSILSHARFTASEGQTESFERIIAELAARAIAEPGTLMYRFFRGTPGTYAVIEQYADAEAAQAHQAANADLLAQIDGCTKEVSITLHGPVGPEIREWAQQAPNVTLFEEPI